MNVLVELIELVRMGREHAGVRFRETSVSAREIVDSFRTRCIDSRADRVQVANVLHNVNRTVLFTPSAANSRSQSFRSDSIS